MLREGHDRAETVRLDVTGQCCPIPLIAVASAIHDMTAGQRLAVTGDDPTFERGMREFCEARGLTVVDAHGNGRKVTVVIQV